MGQCMHRMVWALVSTVLAIASGVAGADTLEAQNRSSPTATPAGKCRYATYGDLMRWGENTNWAQDWTQQYFACGVNSLPPDLEYAFNNAKTMGRDGRYVLNHQVYAMSTNSHARLPQTQADAKACNQARQQIAANDKWRAAHKTLPESDPAVVAVRKSTSDSRSYLARNCK